MQAIKPELTEVNIGFIPLTDCAPLVLASTMGFDEKYGIKIRLSKEASWSAIRDKLISGDLHAAHALYGMVYGVELGIGAQQKAMAVLMTLNQNGQGITLSNQLKTLGIVTGSDLSEFLKQHTSKLSFAQTFPTGTHAMWLYYWLASQNIHPLHDIKTTVVSPPQMVANISAGNVAGYCAGEPWNARAVYDNVGFTVATSQDIWADHPEKVLGVTAEFANAYPQTCRAMIMAVLEACRYLDVMANRSEVTAVLAAKEYVNAPQQVIYDRFIGQYDNGNGKQWQDAHAIKFFNDGAVTYPYLSDAMWFMTQFKRWGLLKAHPDYLAVANKVNRIDLYQQAAQAMEIAVPQHNMRSSRLIDEVIWDGSHPAAYADNFSIRA
ncbi:MAG: nitrate transporter [Methylotenera sp. 24-45-7]|jgi:nitrate/nitrite transport system substrate-binding protein|nr:MAG: nitrate transporter [Mehylophilales bacterium 35-46-6]OYY80936.1 MAG: nitrate transporter [Methylophilales bacterium 16-45-9]OYZ41168.1 MAG: nitrate transporter [Methylotenera sp. 24-45-7]OZA07857.1 MAG: nitrate transporter [Methylotenera sp. 17-45-7]OZA54237.1 MAG: nitrate transporter [Methylophilales bacterium 39-45-7]HQS37173.1 CmpA/NrtA family ABC transporter substrate-binding protein [Methylotenera sp.]